MMDKQLTRLRRWPWSYGLIVLSISACSDVFDNIISVEVPDRVEWEALDDPVHASLLAASVQATFECALSSDIFVNGLFTDELTAFGGTGYGVYDLRNPQPVGGTLGQYADGDCDNLPLLLGIYRPLSSARWFADDLLAKLDRWTDAQVPDRQSLIARTAAYAGYSLIRLGESMCSAALDNGPELGPAQLFQQAEARFDRAITAAQAAGTSEILNMARVGRARARINQGNGAGAVEDARAVPRDFVALATRAAGHNARENAVFVVVTRTRFAGVEESFRDVTWQGVPDPRVPVVDMGVTAGDLPYFDQRKYNNEAAGIPIARWEEAQLIIAEVEGGQSAIDIINELHARAGIPPFTADAGDAEAIRAQVIEERRREFFLEGHRVGDVRRFELPLIPPPGSPYRSSGMVYGSSVCYPLPDVERTNNPNIPG